MRDRPRARRSTRASRFVSGGHPRQTRPTSTPSVLARAGARLGPRPFLRRSRRAGARPASSPAYEPLVARRERPRTGPVHHRAPGVLGTRASRSPRRPDPAAGDRAHRRRGHRCSSQPDGARGPAARRRARGVEIVDVGTGSGCLAVALAREIPGARVIATDVSGSGPGGRPAQRPAARRRRPGAVLSRRAF